MFSWRCRCVGPGAYVSTCSKVLVGLLGRPGFAKQITNLRRQFRTQVPSQQAHGHGGQDGALGPDRLRVQGIGFQGSGSHGGLRCSWPRQYPDGSTYTGCLRNGLKHGPGVRDLVGVEEEEFKASPAHIAAGQGLQEPHGSVRGRMVRPGGAFFSFCLADVCGKALDNESKPACHVQRVSPFQAIGRQDDLQHGTGRQIWSDGCLGCTARGNQCIHA